MIDLDEVGVHLSLKADNQWQLQAGIYLPNITPEKAYQLNLRVIQENDQFIRSIESLQFKMQWTMMKTIELSSVFYAIRLSD